LLAVGGPSLQFARLSNRGRLEQTGAEYWNLGTAGAFGRFRERTEQC
jgi:hypothetical protein